jgi:hypothetical protein
MEHPIACTLSPGQYRQRTGHLADLAARALLARQPTTEGERLVFADDAETERELRAAVAAEARCCAFLRLDLQRTEAGLVLDIAGPAEARPIIAELFA